VARRLLVRKTNRKRQWTSIHTWSCSLKAFDQWVGHRPFVEVSADDWASTIDDHLAPEDGLPRRPGAVERSTMSTRVGAVGEFLRAALGCKDLPLDVEDSLMVVADDEDTRQARIISPDEQRTLLEHIVHHEERYRSAHNVATKQWVVHGLDDTGFRLDEFRSINNGQWVFRPDGGCKVKLCSRREAIQRGCRLKSRHQREIVFYKAVPMLKVLLALHPRGDDPDAPTLLAFRDRSGLERMSKQVANDWIRRLGIQAGLSPIPGRASPLTPHDFRHTRITRATKQRPFNFPEFSMYFWGIPDSKEAATYMHLNGDDMATVARSNLGVDAYGYPTPQVDVGAEDVNARLALLQAELDRLKGILPRPAP
jgi:integrase